MVCRRATGCRAGAHEPLAEFQPLLVRNWRRVTVLSIGGKRDEVKAQPRPDADAASWNPNQRPGDYRWQNRRASSTPTAHDLRDYDEINQRISSQFPEDRTPAEWFPAILTDAT
jgi:hypothetical protein